MTFVVACLIGIAFLSVRVQPEDPNDETNNICLNTTGHNCKTNPSSGTPAHLMKTITKPTNPHLSEWGTQPPETQPPVLLAPATQLPETQPHEMQAPATESPKTQPPTTTTALQTHLIEPPPRPWDVVENDNGDRTTEMPSKETEYLELKFQLCLKPSCAYYCRTKDYSDGTCTSLADCLCSRMSDSEDILVMLCNRYTCSYFCSMEDYPYGTCTNMENCQCTKRKSSVKVKSALEEDFPFKDCSKEACTNFCTLEKYSDGSCTDESNCHCKGVKELQPRNREEKSTSSDQKICSDALCEVFCREGGHSKNICIDENRCKCGDLVPTTPKMNESITEPLQTTKLTTLGELKDNERDFPVRVCILAQCKYMCIKHKYKKGYCVHGQPPKCRCYSE